MVFWAAIIVPLIPVAAGIIALIQMLIRKKIAEGINRAGLQMQADRLAAEDKIRADKSAAEDKAAKLAAEAARLANEAREKESRLAELSKLLDAREDATNRLFLEHKEIHQMLRATLVTVEKTYADKCVEYAELYLRFKQLETELIKERKHDS